MLARSFIFEQQAKYYSIISDPGIRAEGSVLI